VAVAAVFLAAPPAAGSDPISLKKLSVRPNEAFLGSRAGVRISFHLAAGAPADLTIRIAGGGREIRAIQLDDVGAGDHTETWDGLSSGGDPAADGSYRVLLGATGGGDQEAGRVLLRGHFFPVRGPHGTRGPVGEFGAGRNGGRTHKGFDITASCGTPLAAVRAGTVIKRQFDPRLDGNFIVIRGLGERRSYLYAHMVKPSPFHRGDEVHTGDVVGRIGRTGNAGSTPCHLHFESHRNGRPIDPEGDLRAWDRYS
jgi:murein DD-endopeptidase MepM/ murein hydrolase activator NlpD